MPEIYLELSRPFFLIKILDKDSNDVKFVWSPNMFMDSERPENNGTVAPDTYIEDIEVKSNFEPPINLGEVKISHGVGKTPQIAIKDVLNIYFGYYTLDNSENAAHSLAYTGQIDSIKAGLNHTIIKSSSKIKKLTDLKRELTFSRIMTISDIIKKLAIDDSGLESAPNGITDTTVSKQKGYAVSKNLSIYEHLKKLADFIDYDIYMDVFDKFNARAWSPEPAPVQTSAAGDSLAMGWIPERDDSESDNQKQLIHPIYFGVNVLNMELDIKKKGPSNIEITSLADTEGDEIFTINPPTGTSGGGGNGGGESSGEGAEKIVLPRFTKDDADKIAQALVSRNNGGLNGSLTIIGTPQVRLGDGVKIKGHIYGKKPFSQIDTQSSEYDASYTAEEVEGSSSQSGSGGETLFKISGIRHLFNDEIGFISKLSITEAAPTPPAAPASAATGAAAGAGPEGVTSTEAEFTGTAATIPAAAEVAAEEETEELEEVDFLTLTGVNFNFDSAVVLTRDLGDIKAIIEKVNRSEKKVLIAGHTDRMGSDEYNLNLSGLRAKSVLAISTGNRGLWNEVIASGKTKVEDYQAILKDFGLYEGEVDGIDGPKTKDALREFQTYYNENYDGDLAVDGRIGPRTWSAIFVVMVDKLDSRIDEGKFKDPRWIGCGEFRPIEQPNVDQVRSEANRRVEFLLYPDHMFPRISPPYASRQAMEAAYNDDVYTFTEIRYDNIPLDVRLTPRVEPGTGELVELAWDTDSAFCGEDLNLTGRASGLGGRDVDITIYLRDRREDGVLDTFTSVITTDERLDADWTVKNLRIEPEGDIYPEQIETQTEAAAGDISAVTEEILALRRIPDITYQTYNATRTSDRTSEGLPRYQWQSTFRQKVEGFTTTVALTLHITKGWLGYRIRIGGNWRWCKRVGTTWQYHDGTNWVNVPGSIGSYTREEIVFRQDGSNFVSDTPGVTGTWPEAFTDFEIPEDKTNAWLTAITNAWDDKFYLKRDGCTSDNENCCRYTVRVEVNFSETEGESMVRAVNGNGRSNSAHWFLGDPDDDMAAHEAGHLFGNFDEYDADGAIDTGDATYNHVPDSIMGDNMSTTHPRHYNTYAEHLGTIAGSASGIERNFEVIRKS